MKLSEKIRDNCCGSSCEKHDIADECERLEEKLKIALAKNALSEINPEERRKIRLDEAQKIRRAGSYQGDRFKKFMIWHIDDLKIREQL